MPTALAGGHPRRNLLSGNWTKKHQISINGKRVDFTRADLAQIAKTLGIKDAKEVLEQVGEAVAL